MRPKYLIPLTTLTLSACGTSTTGDWELEEVDHPTMGIIDLPIKGSGEKYAIFMTLEDPDKAEFISTYIYEDGSDPWRESHSGVWAEIEKRRFEIQIEDIDVEFIEDQDSHLDMTCSRNGRVLDCESATENGTPARDTIKSRWTKG